MYCNAANWFTDFTVNSTSQDTAVQNLCHAIYCAIYIIRYCGNAILQTNGFRTEKMHKSLSFLSRKKLLPFQWYGGAMLAILEESSVTNKGTTVRTNVHSKSCLLCYVICYVTANVCTVTGATVCWFVTNSSGWQLFSVKLPTIQTETVHAINVNNKTLM